MTASTDAVALTAHLDCRRATRSLLLSMTCSLIAALGACRHRDLESERPRSPHPEAFTMTIREFARLREGFADILMTFGHYDDCARIALWAGATRRDSAEDPDALVPFLWLLNAMVDDASRDPSGDAHAWIVQFAGASEVPIRIDESAGSGLEVVELSGWWRGGEMAMRLEPGSAYAMGGVPAQPDSLYLSEVRAAVISDGIPAWAEFIVVPFARRVFAIPLRDTRDFPPGASMRAGTVGLLCELDSEPAEGVGSAYWTSPRNVPAVVAGMSRAIAERWGADPGSVADAVCKLSGVNRHWLSESGKTDGVLGVATIHWSVNRGSRRGWLLLRVGDVLIDVPPHTYCRVLGVANAATRQEEDTLELARVLNVPIVRAGQFLCVLDPTSERVIQIDVGED